MLTRSKRDLTHEKITTIINNNPLPFRKQYKYFLLFDLESFQFNLNMTDKEIDKETNIKNDIKNDIKNEPLWTPHQFAWSIFKVLNGTEIIPILNKNYYVSEIWIDQYFRQEMLTSSKNAMKIHLEQMKRTQYPMKRSIDILKDMINDIEEFNVSILCGYNITSDFKAIKTLYNTFSNPISNDIIEESLFSINRINPFKISVDYLDLMTNTSMLYMDYLIEEGLKDEKIFRNAKTKRIKLRGRDDTKSIYSAEYIVKKFFDLKQTHYASDDVDVESKLLNKLLHEKGFKQLELNDTYSNDLYRLFSDKITNDYKEQIKTLSLFSDIDTYSYSNTTSSITTSSITTSNTITIPLIMQQETPTLM